ncbi:MAG: metallophosphoesterase, partial [Nitrosopumilus sp.]|nr:metallophosphoesterase [Nitrosopumilus sp.]
MIKRKINKVFASLCAGITIVNILSAQVISPFNKIEIKDTLDSYTFIVSGHFHGASTNASTFPSSSLLANIDTLNALKPQFLMSLGDLFVDVNDTYIKNYQNSLFDKIKTPLFNAVGNHDISNGNIYEKVFGKTFFSFEYGSELYIVLNTELNDGSISGEQLDFLKKVLFGSVSDNKKNIFIFSHRPIWS